MLNVISRCGSYLSIGLLTVLLVPVAACGGGDDGPKLTSEQLEECRDPSEGDELIEAAEEVGIQFSEEFQIQLDEIWDEWDGDISGATYREFKKDRSNLVRTQPWFEEACAEMTAWMVRD